MAIVESEIRKWFDVFHTENPLVEIRVLNKGRGVRTISGYFKRVEDIIASVSRFDKYGIYAPINDIKESCYGRVQHDTMVENPENTTGDNDIEGRRWILIDIDPKRPSGTNASNEEKKFAYNVMCAVGQFLKNQGFSEPIVIDSANGYHLYYRIRLANSDDNTSLITSFLKVMDMFFSTAKAEIDTAVFNASRIAKITGTYSAKGSSTTDRPQRLCKFIRIPEVIKDTDIVYIKKVVGMLPEQEKPCRFNGYKTDNFDIHSFLREHNVEVVKTAHFKDGQKLILKECPFNHEHTAPDSAIFIMNNGAIGFKCLHNSCSQYTWRDLRVKLDPNAYEKREREMFNQKESYYSTNQKPAPTIVEETADKGKKWLSMVDIEWYDPSKMTYIPTGITELDKSIGGLSLGDVSVMTGIAGSGKTSMLNFITLNVIQRGYKVAVWSGELQPSRFQAWIDQAAAGKGNVIQNAGYHNWWYCPKHIAEKINSWLDAKLFLYNNEYGNKWSQLFADIKDCVETNNTQLVIVDNLASMNLDIFSGDKNSNQSTFIADLKNYAKLANIHIILIIHPRKELGNTLLRMESISGSGDLYNLVDNVLINHRIGEDFKKRATEFFGADKVSTYYDDKGNKKYDEVIEVAKNRSLGVKDKLIGLHFEIESRRFKNTPEEHINYDWNVTPTPMTLDMYDDYDSFDNDKSISGNNEENCPF